MKFESRRKMKKKEMITVILLTLAITFMDITGIPCILLFHISAWDVDPFIFSLMINFALIALLAVVTLRYLCPNWKLGLCVEGIKNGLKKYALAGIIAGVLSCAAFCIGLYPFDYQPTFWKVLFEGILYYIGVGFIEEFYVRGLFQNLLEKICEKRANKEQIAIIVASVVFGLGHIPGLLGMGMVVILFKVISTIGMGLYFGVIYQKTRNLWIPAIMHSFIDICALPYCFTTYRGYPDITLYLLLAIYVVLGIYSLQLMKKKVEYTDS